MFSPADIEEAHERLGAMCGHAALAAALQCSVTAAMDHFNGVGGWVNVPMMKAAIVKGGRSWMRAEQAGPEDVAVMLIQFVGPWTNPGVPPAAACAYRHWVAVRRSLLWDVNWPEWQSRETWGGRVSELLPAKATGWRVWGVLKVT